MANIYKFNVKKIVGNLNKTTDTLYAENLNDACFKLADLISVKIVDENYSYFLNKVSETVDDKKKFAVLNFEDDGETVSAFIEQMNDRILNWKELICK